jgi:hypothetical protein
MKPLHYALAGAAAVILLLAAGFFIGRGTKHCKEYVQQDYESVADGWKAAATSWKAISERGQAERAALQQYIDDLNEALNRSPKLRADETFRVLNDLSNDSLANILLTAPHGVE